MIEVRTLSTSSPEFEKTLRSLLAYESVANKEVIQSVEHIIDSVKDTGDKAVIEFTAKFDRLDVTNVEQLKLSKAQMKEAYLSLPHSQQQALSDAAERIRLYHLKQAASSWQYQEEDGTVLGQKVTPLDSVGLYVPGGKAAYPSSVLMNAVPAKVAGVERLVMTVPTPDGVLNPLVLAAAYVAEVDEAYTIGGAQAVAALAYGTQTIQPVDKIVGPGNIFVATAKRMVFGKVGIDMIAGPSEIVVVCDGKTDPDWIAMDLFSQAEHDEDAQAILLCPDADYISKVKASMTKILQDMPRADIIKASMADRGLLIQVADMDEAIRWVNVIAPEHLELSVDEPEQYLEAIRHAGAIFMGRYTAEALGDYCAGPNHVLPTSGTARFSSPLGVYDFQKRSSIINCSPKGASVLGAIAAELADGEGLTAHAESARFRIQKESGDE